MVGLDLHKLAHNSMAKVKHSGALAYNTFTVSNRMYSALASSRKSKLFFFVRDFFSSLVS